MQSLLNEPSPAERMRPGRKSRRCWTQAIARLNEKDRRRHRAPVFREPQPGRRGPGARRERRRGPDAGEPGAGKAAAVFHETRREFDHGASLPGRFPPIPFKPRPRRWQNP